jgi:hypothetical protein
MCVHLISILLNMIDLDAIVLAAVSRIIIMKFGTDE